MRPDQLHPAIRHRIRFLPSIPAGPLGRVIGRAVRARLPEGRLPEGVLSGLVGDLPGGPSRLYVPAPGTPRTGAALLWIHGGGLVSGSAAQDHQWAGRLCAALGVVVVSAEYRLAPEHPYPVPLDDCRAVWEWLLEHAGDLGVDTGRLAVGGQSAGGGLAAALAQRLRDEGGPQPAAQWLFCPMLDDRTAADRALDGIRHPVWDNRSNRAGWASYLGVEPGATEPAPPGHAVPARRRDLAGLPPAWIGVGDADLFHQEDCAYAERLRAAGVDTVLDVMPGAPHGVETLAGEVPWVRAYVGRARDWLADRLADRPADRPVDGPQGN
ncbi:alpha/beta hydrolase [Streptomyces chilikensis]|uniref:Alpha/beta hydrolase n=1 Tax=Streptomyces chilikensis TaxID=1194079 RepID=A0ABV3EUT4_9ACTN